MRWRGVSHVEFAVLDYDDSIGFYDALFGLLGYSSFSSMNMEYQSIYYMTRYVNPHSYIGIQPARSGDKLTHSDQAVGINHTALWARSRKEVDRFHREFLLREGVPVSDAPQEYPQYWPGYYAVFFDDPVNGIHWELAWVPKCLPRANFGRSTERSALSTKAGPIWPTRCSASPGRQGGPCRLLDYGVFRGPSAFLDGRRG
jgi:catechol 2,3-dioxygenase-like lactoylglutathione lyase family enzyme